ncbi:protein of unknown function [Candidatus Nitrosocosmicus franklandus]|uniref:Uncharacterized protein n=1 Tax=Candidatus Nitrosocosmicus franklandianus TaxID=1798806 RepID=A0A484IDL6_9ARCH|nr:protein of unknown function [Candidatus Nitrosocosmicus franklandus]
MKLKLQAIFNNTFVIKFEIVFAFAPKINVILVSMKINSTQLTNSCC